MSQITVSEMLRTRLDEFSIASDEWGSRSQAINLMYRVLDERVGRQHVELPDDAALEAVAEAIETLPIPSNSSEREILKRGCEALRDLAEIRLQLPKTLGELSHLVAT